MLFTKLPDLLVAWAPFRQLLHSANRTPTTRPRAARSGGRHGPGSGRASGSVIGRHQVGSRITGARRVVALALIVPFIFASCTPPTTTTTTPTVEYVPPTTLPPEDSSSEELSDDEAMDIALSELARHLRQELGPDWISRTRGAMDGRLVAAGVPADSVEALHDLMRKAIATTPAADTVDDTLARSDFRLHMRDSLDSRMVSEVAFDRAPGPTGTPPDALPSGDFSCDIYNACRGQNYNGCYRYADSEVRAHEAMLWAGCAFVAALGTVVTLGTAAVLAGLCIAAPSYWSAMVHSDAMDLCFTSRCGSYPSCI